MEPPASQRMTPVESADLLWRVCLGDRYERGQTRDHLEQWYEVVGHLHHADACAALVWWRQNQAEDPTPADLIRRSRIIAGERRRLAERAVDGPAVLQRTPEQQAYVEAQVARIRPIVAEERELAAPRWRALSAGPAAELEATIDLSSPAADTAAPPSPQAPSTSSHTSEPAPEPSLVGR